MGPNAKENREQVFSVLDVDFVFFDRWPFLEVFRRLTFDIGRGETFAVLGPSGVGKSLLLKMLAGLIAPMGGKILWEGEDLQTLPAARRKAFSAKIAMTFQRGALFDSLTAGDNLRLPLKEVLGLDRSEMDLRVCEALEEVGLGGQEDRRVHELSGGMQKRLGIARALVLTPEIVLFDDPTAGLDPITSRAIVELIQQVKQRHQMTVVLVTSDPEQAYQLSSRIGFLYRGAFLQVGSTSDIRKSTHPVLYQFLNGRVEGPLTEGVGDS